MRVRIGMLVVGIALTVGCGQTPSQSLPTSASVISPSVQASEPPYGQELSLGHAGQVWVGIVPANPCNVGPWTGHGHSSVEVYNTEEPFEFLYWDCTGGQNHSNGSTVGILD